MEQNKGVKKETRRHYIGYFRDGECHVERLECVEVYEYDSKWHLVESCFNQMQSWSYNSDDIVKSTNITYLGSWSDDWNICIQPLLHDDESEQEANGQKCWITIRDLEYAAFDDGMLHEFVDF